jgi:ABC-2 type transport system ATP-binding protein
VANAIEISGVSKRFRLDHERHSTLKERVIHPRRRRSGEDFWALRDIDLEVEQGETVGLIGHNGSGKSTLLKCIGGILQPSTGLIRTRGRLASLLELGAGFHPDLTGRENVYLNASILGLSSKDIDRRFDEIVAFAELEQFIDQQVKHYSSGMYVRLGFSVATNVDPDVLLVDEVLAVGDEAFQRKCLDRVRQFQHDGRTIVFVTHGVDLVRQICDRAVVLDHGRMIEVGDPSVAVRTFRESLLAGAQVAEAEPAPAADGAAPATGDGAVPAEELDHGTAQERKRNLRVRITEVAFEHPHADERPYLLPGEPLTVRVGFDAAEEVEEVVFGLAIYDVEGQLLLGSNTALLGQRVGPVLGAGEVRFTLEGVPLHDGSYPVTIGIHSPDEGVVYDWWEQRERFAVMSPGRAAGLLALPVHVTVAGAATPQEIPR